ncbi:hypothetical protein LCGC14_0504020 [marine sediment metagenome]|uniref:Uncharacterized protein n=1 Tax=marine sediment metagenome TaxID=412755 RepID=A0A0F9SLH2_9ZZZZ
MAAPATHKPRKDLSTRTQRAVTLYERVDIGRPAGLANDKKPNWQHYRLPLKEGAK